jgi:ATP-dependent protease ClpP protease subunit
MILGKSGFKTQAGIYDGNPTTPTVYGVPNGGIKYIINITDDFDSANRYDEVIALLANATEMDELWWNIASYGGFVNSLQMLLGWKAMCPAKQVHVLHSNADSCASVFFLSPADEYIVGDGASMFCHEIQAGASGTTSNLEKRVSHLVKQNKQFVRDAYLDFLDEETIESILKGTEVYLDANEIRERLEARESKRREQATNALQQTLEDSDKPLSQEDLQELSDEDLEYDLKEIDSVRKVYLSEIKKRKTKK